MRESLITFETAKLAKEKGFNVICENFFNSGSGYKLQCDTLLRTGDGVVIEAPTQSLLQKFIREIRGVHIEIYRNASGYYWGMCRADGGTDLGWSNYSGPDASGVWGLFEDSLENALKVQLFYDLPNDTKVIKHWGNYVEFALKNIKKEYDK